MLAYLPVETLIKQQQEQYYKTLGEADAQADSTPFVEFLLQAILASLTEAITTENNTQTSSEKSTEIGSEKTLSLLLKNPVLSAKQIAEQLHISQRAVEKHLAQLKKHGKISRIGSPKKGYWEVKG